jgi:AcrR family transcriptional regulator
MKSSIFFQAEEDRKAKIITSALRIIDRKGVKGLTVARLSQEVGFVESALYRHFKSKADLIAFILDNSVEEARRHFEEVEKNLADVLEALRGLLYLHLKFLEQYPGIFRIIYSDEIHLGDEKLIGKLDNLTSEIINFIKKIIQKGKEQRILKPDLDTTMGAMHFLGLIYTAYSYWTIKKRKVSLNKIGQILLEQYLKGVKA